MSLTPEEQRALADECGAIVNHWTVEFDRGEEAFTMMRSNLSAYTAAVEAKERERCAVHFESLGAGYEMFTGTITDELRSLK